jgi:hypothetical protein
VESEEQHSDTEDFAELQRDRAAKLEAGARAAADAQALHSFFQQRQEQLQQRQQRQQLVQQQQQQQQQPTWQNLFFPPSLGADGGRSSSASSSARFTSNPLTALRARGGGTSWR